MRNYITFLGKEMTENLRTKKLMVMAIVFIFFAILGPVTARYIGDLMYALLPTGEAEAFAAMFGDPHWGEAYTQFYANMMQIGTITVILLYMGSIVREKRSGTSDLVLTKGLRPATMVLAKFTIAVLVTAVVMLVAVLVTFAYTYILFDEAGNIGEILLSGAVFYAFFVMMIAATIFFSSIAKGTGRAAVMGLIFFFALMIPQMLPRISNYAPAALLAWPTVMVEGNMPPLRELLIILGITGALTIFFLLCAIRATAVKNVT
jgi:ABC-2 type transport system permease protein